MKLYRLEIDKPILNTEMNVGIYKQQEYFIDISEFYNLGNLCDGMSLGTIDGEESYKTSHPIPHNDPLLCDTWIDLDYTEDYYFAFKSLDDLKKWFSNLHDPRLDKYIDNIRVGVYEIPKHYVHIGTQQVIAYYKHFKFIKSLNPREV